MALVYLALGSNLGEPQQQVLRAIEELKHLPQSNLQKTSSLYQTPALGEAGQPDYINAVVQLETTLYPMPLLEALMKIEQKQGRTRTSVRWQARTLDLDILLYDNQRIEQPLLTIPHPGITERAFVLLPLLEIAPKLCLPNGEALQSYLAKMDPSELERNRVVLG